MYEPIHFPVPFCRFGLEHLTPSHLRTAAGIVAGLTGTDSAAGRHDDDAASASAPSLRLNHVELWRKFSTVGTEMVITKSGRHVYAIYVHI